MRNIPSILIAAMLALFLIGEISASGYSGNTESEKATAFMMKAIKHAEMARTHKAHAEHIHKHAEASLEYVKKAEAEAIDNENTGERRHITESIRHLVQAITHAKAGHADIASEHVTDALEEMRQFITQ
ncbi:MAG: hypothetical protein HRU77_14185 [Gammaproteobacteria bacterium]|jgi:hypothetical protein|nr:hypothetical protein [Pseudomonadota bacterium]QOJ21727.1 MAG: hypothetical protein HRU77_14185 [Gammaproteobacteria bacterium]